MNQEQLSPQELREVVVRICPACSVVNPAGPSESCPHVQLIRFDGIDESLAELLGKVAEARAAFNLLVSKLKTRAKDAVRSGEAEVETTRKGRVSDVKELTEAPAKPLALENPEPAHQSKNTRKPKRKTPVAAKVDPRQLDLLLREPPKGDA